MNLLFWAAPASLKPTWTRTEFQNLGERISLQVDQDGLGPAGFVRSQWLEVWTAADPGSLAAVRRAGVADPLGLYRPPPLVTWRPMIVDWGPMHVVGPDGVETVRTGSVRVLPYHLLAAACAVPIAWWAVRRRARSAVPPPAADKDRR